MCKTCLCKRLSKNIDSCISLIDVTWTETSRTEWLCLWECCCVLMLLCFFKCHCFLLMLLWFLKYWCVFFWCCCVFFVILLSFLLMSCFFFLKYCHVFFWCRCDFWNVVAFSFDAVVYFWNILFSEMLLCYFSSLYLIVAVAVFFSHV